MSFPIFLNMCIAYSYYLFFMYMYILVNLYSYYRNTSINLKWLVLFMVHSTIITKTIQNKFLKREFQSSFNIFIIIRYQHAKGNYSVRMLHLQRKLTSFISKPCIVIQRETQSHEFACCLNGACLNLGG